jgi:hypothetical protein
MPAEAKKYQDYARECVRLAGQADTPQLRDKLLDLARIWMDAALTEEETAAPRPSFPSGRPGARR